MRNWITGFLTTTLVALSTAVAGDAAIDHAKTVRSVVLRAAPSIASAPVAEVVAQTGVDIYQRQGLWVRLALSDDPARTGWLRFTELRFSDSGAASQTSASRRGGGFAGFSRSVSGFLSRLRGGGQANRQHASTATIGIRGLTVSDLKTARADTQALAQAQSYRATREQAEQFAKAAGLRARAVP